jgi:hypothetical protein
MTDADDLAAALRATSTARGDYLISLNARLRRVEAERDALAAKVRALDTAWVRRQEPEIHNACEGHALCDLIASVEAIQRTLTDTPDGGDTA